MPASKTAALEKRIEKLERELAAYKRQLSKAAPGANAAPRQLAELRAVVHEFVETALAHGIRFWSFHPDVAAAADKLLNATDPQPATRTPK